MTSSQVGSSLSRFRLESHDHNGLFVASLPYRNLQGEWLLSNSAGGNLRGEIPYRGNSQVTPANVYTGKHELWLYDEEVSTDNPIFAGPIWDLTASSDSGTLNFACQDALSYLTKRVLKAFKAYSSQRTDQMLNNLITYTNGVRALNMTVVVKATSAQTSSQTFLAADRKQISDLFEQIAALNDKCDFYVRNINGVHTLYLYGGQIKPSAKSFAIEYGGSAMNGYSVQYLGTSLANDVDIIGANGIIGNSTAAAKQTEYNALYQFVDSSDQITSTDLNNTAAQAIKDRKSTKVIPTVVTKTKTPIKDFDFGDQFTVTIDDWYVQVSQTNRIVGWQYTIGQGDKTTAVLYTKDTEGVT